MSKRTSPEKRSGLRHMPLEEWPTSHQLAWTAAHEPGDILDGDAGLAVQWAPATRLMAMAGHGRFLAWMAREGLLNVEAQPGVQATPEIIRLYLADMQRTLAPHTVATQLQQVGNAMRALAPGQDWTWIQRGADRVRATATSVRDKRARLQSPADLVALGLDLMDTADAADTMHRIERATAFRDGLTIALLAHRPIRRSNLASICCDRHLVRRGDGWQLVFPADEIKSRTPLEFSVPTQLVPYLERYLKLHRPLLLATNKLTTTPATGLWVSRRGTQMGGAALFHQIRDRTKAAFGVALNPHMFRDCAATEIATSAPDQAIMIKTVLGHAGMATSERHYNLAGSVEAGRRYGDTIAKIRQS